LLASNVAACSLRWTPAVAPDALPQHLACYQPSQSSSLMDGGSETMPTGAQMKEV